MNIPKAISPERTKAIEEVKTYFLYAYEEVCQRYNCYVDIGWPDSKTEGEPPMEVTFGHDYFASHMKDLHASPVYDLEKN